MIKQRTLPRAELAMKKFSTGAQSNFRELRPRSPVTESGKCPFIVVSRQCGVGAHQIAERVAQNLQWQVFDHELLDQVAQQFHVSASIIEAMDERTVPWLTDLFTAGTRNQRVTPQACVHRVAEVIRESARKGNCVIVGRGAQFILPHDRGLFVRLIGSEDYRARNVAQLEGLSLSEAKQKVQSVDKDRAEFMKCYYHHDITDPAGYDLVINVERTGLAGTVDCILSAYRSMDV